MFFCVSVCIFNSADFIFKAFSTIFSSSKVVELVIAPVIEYSYLCIDMYLERCIYPVFSPVNSFIRKLPVSCIFSKTTKDIQVLHVFTKPFLCTVM